jgi:hypothetical protein
MRAIEANMEAIPVCTHFLQIVYRSRVQLWTQPGLAAMSDPLRVGCVIFIHIPIVTSQQWALRDIRNLRLRRSVASEGVLMAPSFCILLRERREKLEELADVGRSA